MKNAEHYPDPTADGALKYHPESEAEAQRKLMKWAQLIPFLRWFHHIPNGGFRQGREAAHLKMMGVKRGVSDLFLPKSRLGFHGLYIEMKSEKGGVISPEQKEFISAVRADGYAAFVCKGFDSARDCVSAYLKEDVALLYQNGRKDEYIWLQRN